MRRLAIYFAPEEDAGLTRLACSWLGRDAFRDCAVSASLNGFSRETWRAATSDPRLYGFHATLKPPFRLASHRREEELKESLRDFAASRDSFDAPPLRVGALSSFLALVLSEPCPAFSDLAAACVTEFDEFRSAPGEQELARRRRAKLNPVQLEHLARWGYPYVMEEWRFHMTLTSSLDPQTLAAMQPHLESLFAPYCQEPLRVDSLCLFEQPGEGEPFSVMERFYFR